MKKGKKEKTQRRQRYNSRVQQYLIVILSAFFLGAGINFVFYFLAPRDTGQQAFSLQSFGALGAPISLEVKGGIPVQDGVQVLKTGAGPVIAQGNQLLYAAASFTYTPGRVLEDNQLHQIRATTADRESLGELATAVLGQKVGSRIAYLKTHVDQGAVEIVILDLLPTRIKGVHLQPPAWPGNPVVHNSAEVLPQVVTFGEVPAEVRTHALIQGNGAQIVQDESVYANYLLVDYHGNVVQNTYLQQKPAKIDPQEVFRGLRQAIVDQRIGTRLLVGIPASFAKGDRDLLAVVDLLAKVEE